MRHEYKCGRARHTPHADSYANADANGKANPDMKLIPALRGLSQTVSTTEEFYSRCVMIEVELELELIQTQMAQKPVLRAEVGMRVRCANKASAE